MTPLVRRRRWQLVYLGLVTLACSSAAFAQSSADRAARKATDAAISEDYLQMNYGQAESRLLGVVKSCRSKCQPATVARAWMYIGVVRGSGKGNLHGARQAFVTALEHDPAVTLDEALATPPTGRAFKAAQNAADESSGEGKSSADPAAPPIGDPVSGMGTEGTGAELTPKRTGLSCTPRVLETQPRRPIPFECAADEEVVRVSLRYREHGTADWKTVEFRRGGAGFRAQVPCEATMDTGRIQFFVVASDAAGDPLDTLGSKSDPLLFSIDPESTAEAPAYPGESAPERCEERVLCPPDFPGCVDDVTADEEDGLESKRAKSSHSIGLHVGFDIGFIGGENVCADANRDFDCFDSGSEAPFPGALPPSVAAEVGEPGDVYPGTGIGTGASPGTVRVLLSYDYALSSHVSLGARLGYAFGGAPATRDGRSFLPIHAEGRVAYWLRGRDGGGILPYLHLGGGVAQVDVRKGDVRVRDCSEEPTREAFLDCIEAVDAYDSANAPELPEKTLDAYRKLGNAFATIGGGMLLPLGADTALQFNLNGMLMLPSIGLVVEPSLGLVYEL